MATKLFHLFFRVDPTGTSQREPSNRSCAAHGIYLCVVCDCLCVCVCMCVCVCTCVFVCLCVCECVCVCVCVYVFMVGVRMCEFSGLRFFVCMCLYAVSVNVLFA